jgi:N-acetylmuramoyl-L-alanine amidase
MKHAFFTMSLAGLLAAFACIAQAQTPAQTAKTAAPKTLAAKPAKPPAGAAKEAKASPVKPAKAPTAAPVKAARGGAKPANASPISAKQAKAAPAQQAIAAKPAQAAHAQTSSAPKSKPSAAIAAKQPRAQRAAIRASKAASAAKPKAPVRNFIVAIDAGHGGKDTGAIGPSGVREKDVVYAIARRLAALLAAEPGMLPLMVRKGDEFIDLEQRAALARRAHADLFISLHADAFPSGEVKGSSVFTLSRHGASSVAARWLAERENSADTMGGVNLHDKSHLLASVLIDLSQNAAIEASDRAALRILSELGKHRPLHHQDVQKAGFAVLKSPDMPSLLVETGFVSNPGEEQQLASPAHQERVAHAIFQGIRAFARKHRFRVEQPPEKAAPADVKPMLVAQP